MKTTPDTAPAGAPEAPVAAEPEVVEQPVAEAPETPDPAPADAPPGDSVEVKRRKDAQAKMHEATGTAAALEKENAELRAALRGIFANPQYRPAEAPADPEGLTDAEVDKLWADYQNVPEGEEKQAYKRMLQQSSAIALKQLAGVNSKERVADNNRRLAVQQATELKTAITAQVQQLAPDVDLDLFWDWGSHVAQREAMAKRFPDVTAMIDWQVNRAIQLVRGKTGSTTARAATPEPEVTSVRQSAARVTPSGSLAPRGGGETTPRRMNMVEQVNALRDKHAAGG
jgi:hypothetical protein